MFEHLPELWGLSLKEYAMGTKYVFFYLGRFSECELVRRELKTH